MGLAWNQPSLVPQCKAESSGVEDAGRSHDLYFFPFLLCHPSELFRVLSQSYSWCASCWGLAWRTVWVLPRSQPCQALGGGPKLRKYLERVRELSFSVSNYPLLSDVPACWCMVHGAWCIVHSAWCLQTRPGWPGSRDRSTTLLPKRVLSSPSVESLCPLWPPICIPSLLPPLRWRQS